MTDHAIRGKTVIIADGANHSGKRRLHHQIALTGRSGAVTATVYPSLLQASPGH